jgi:IS4 transposase
MRREIEIATQRYENGFRAWMNDDSHNEVTRTYLSTGATRSEAFDRCREYAQGSQISLIGRTAAWWHYNAEAGRPMSLDKSAEWDFTNPAVALDSFDADVVMNRLLHS